MNQDKSPISLEEKKDEAAAHGSGSAIATFLNAIYLGGAIPFSKINSDLKQFSRRLECRILSAAQQSGLSELSLELGEDDHGHCLRISEEDLRDFTDAPGLECSRNLASFFQEIGVERIVLDTKLECSQFSEVVKLLWGLRKSLNRASAEPVTETAIPTDTREKADAPKSRLGGFLRWEEMLRDIYSPSGLNAYCACTKLDRKAKTLSIIYSYCETTFSRVVKEYKQRDDFFKDHRAFFRVAPRYAIIFACLTLLPLLAFVISMEWPGAQSITVVVAFLSATVATLVGLGVFVFFQTVGSIEYDKETQAERLEKAYDELNEAHKRIQNDLDTARNIQLALMPRPEDALLQGVVGIATSFMPAASVGGDYFDFKEIREKELAIVFADVSGHGLSAAYITGIIKTIFESHHRTGAADEEGPGASFMKRLNSFLITMTPTESYATVFYAIYCAETSILKYVNAGHSPLPIVARRESPEITYLEGARCLPVGIAEDCDYDPSKIRLAQGDKLFLCTDGVTEAWNKEGEQFGEKRLRETIESQLEIAAHQSVQSILQAVRDFTEGEQQHDDITLMAMEVKR